MPGGSGRRLRVLQQVASAGDEPQYWARAGDLSNAERNRLLEEMRRDGQPSPGRRSMLPTGDEVIFWFNAGPVADDGSTVPMADRVFVTGARCPHQGVCLAEGELREIEDLAGVRRPVVRCPRHNRLFDICTGEGQGNYDTLRRYRARFIQEHQRFYVEVGPTPLHPARPAANLSPLDATAAHSEPPIPLDLEKAHAYPSSELATDDDMAIDLVGNGHDAKRLRGVGTSEEAIQVGCNSFTVSPASLPRPTRTLAPQRTVS